MKTSQERAIELLVERATGGLTAAQESELQELLAGHPDLAVESFELAAAAIELAGTVPEEPLPADLHRRLTLQAEELDQQGEKARPSGSENVTAFPQQTTPGRSGAAMRWLGWAAAAAILLAALGLWPEREVGEASGPAPVDAVAGATDLLELPWTATEDPAAAGASGTVVWSTQLQRGYMRFRGLPVNDPQVFQYQVWIFDAERDERYPVDGGVFDVLPGNEVVVPIKAKLRVENPTLFAVTVEKPGGVVVSSRERLSLLAEVG